VVRFWNTVWNNSVYNAVLFCLFPVCNVSLNRPSYQSSVRHEIFGPNLANDGSWTNILSSDAGAHCVHSESETNSWWAVDLGIPLSVKEIFFRNRLNAGKYTFSHFTLLKSLRWQVVCVQKYFTQGIQALMQA